MRPRQPSRFSVFITILSIFSAVVLLIGTAVTLTNYVQTQDAAVELADDTFSAAIRRISEQQESLFAPLVFFAELYSQDGNVKAGQGAMENILPSILRGMELSPHVFQVYAGYENGDYYQVFSFGSSDSDMIADMGGPPGTRFAIHEITRNAEGIREVFWRYLDDDQVDLKRTAATSTTYDPRLRDWYKSARANPENVVRTPPYVFAVSPEVGLSFAKAFDGPIQGAVSTDITLDRLSTFLRSMRPNDDHRLLVFDDEMRLLGAPDPDQVIKRSGAGNDLELAPAKVTDLEDPIVQQALQMFAQGGPFQLETIDIGDEVYLATVAHHDRAGSADYILYAAPRSEFEGTLAGAATRSLLPGLLVLLLASPAIVYLARMISRPLTELSHESELIRSFNLNDPIEMDSPVREVNALITSMSHMKGTLRETSKFVPKTLVKDILESEGRVEVGGKKQHVSVLFTEVADFSDISSKISAEKLMVHMSEYFDELVSLITKDDGTVDKFVGETIFAYWNAPLPIDNYERTACISALKCHHASERLSAQWIAKGRTPWKTRFGVHAGDVIVGNVGSSDRIDYTVIGDTVNIGSRLEGLNKFYGTRILVSGQIADACSDEFLFRHIDRSLPKGAGKPLEIYELLGMFDGPEEFQITPAHAALVVDWNNVYEVYASRDWFKALDAMEEFLGKYPDDGVAKIYLERITEFLIEPPSPEWDGIMRFKKK